MKLKIDYFMINREKIRQGEVTVTQDLHDVILLYASQFLLSETEQTTNKLSKKV